MRGWQRGPGGHRGGRRRTMVLAGAVLLAGAAAVAGCGPASNPAGAHLRIGHRAAVAAPTTTSAPAMTTTTSDDSSAEPATTTSTTTSSSAPIVLGADWSENQQGYGESRPTEVFNGGDPTGLVQGITWSSWGGDRATGTGTSVDATNSDSVADAPQHQATIVAFDPGTCNGTYMYQAVEWYFPIDGQSFNPATYQNVCMGTYVGGEDDHDIAPQASYPPCTEAALRSGLTSGDDPQSGAGTFDQFGCDGNFAWAAIDFTEDGVTNEGPALFLAHGNSWETADRATYCYEDVPSKISDDICNVS